MGTTEVVTQSGTCIAGHFVTNTWSTKGTYAAAGSDSGALSRLALTYGIGSSPSKFSASLIKCNGEGGDACAGNEYSGMTWVSERTLSDECYCE
jgi:hypothetical protein